MNHPKLTASQLQSAARAMCLVRGDDPDEAMWPRRGSCVVGEDRYVRKWELCAREIRRVSEVEAVLSGVEGKGNRDAN